MTELRVGVVGFSYPKYNPEEAEQLIVNAFDKVLECPAYHRDTQVTVVSGLTDLGIPGIAYREAVKRGWRTAGVACTKAEEGKENGDFDWFPVDEKPVIVGQEWGEESEAFLDSIHILVRIGGGSQSMKEAEAFKNKGGHVYEYEFWGIWHKINSGEGNSPATLKVTNGTGIAEFFLDNEDIKVKSYGNGKRTEIQGGGLSLTLDNVRNCFQVRKMTWMGYVNWHYGNWDGLESLLIGFGCWWTFDEYGKVVRFCHSR